MGRLINNNIPTKEYVEPAGTLFIPNGNRDKRYKILEITQEVNTAAGVLAVGDRVVVGTRSGIEVFIDKEKLIIINEAEILYIL